MNILFFFYYCHILRAVFCVCVSASVLHVHPLPVVDCSLRVCPSLAIVSVQ